MLDTHEKSEEIRNWFAGVGGTRYGGWIGLTDEVEEGTWVWDKTGEEATYFAWADYSPSDNNELNCVTLYAPSDPYNYLWEDCRCDTDDAFHAICEREIISP